MITAGQAAAECLDEHHTIAHELDSSWRRAQRCFNGNCVEIRQLGPEVVQIRDSKQSHLGGGAQPILTVPMSAYVILLDELVGDVPFGTNGEIVVSTRNDGDTVFRSSATGVELVFDAGEMAAFIEDVKASGFRPVLQPTK